MEKEENVCIADKWHGKTVSVLGTDYTIMSLKESDDDYLEDKAAYINFYDKQIIIDKEGHNCQFLSYVKETLRHEIIHSFLYECGLDESSGEVDAWATNEEMVDWFAIQSPKIFGEFSRLKLI